jgi:hypothetical protein
MNFDYQRDRRLFELTDEQEADQSTRRYLLTALKQHLEATPTLQDQHRAVLDAALRATERRIALRNVELRHLEKAAHLIPRNLQPS